MKKVFFIIIIISCLVLIWIIYLNWVNISPFIEKHIYKLWPPKRRIYETFTEKERESIDILAKKINGKIVWASNRKGNHDIYLLDLSRKTVRNMTDHPHQDICPKFSPDGKWVAFMRSKREQASFREHDAWDIYAINTDTGSEIFLASATHPTWTSDSKYIVFERDNKIYKININTQKMELILDGDYNEPFIFNDNSKLALVARTSEFKGIGILDLDTKELRKIYHGQACHVFIDPENKYIYWVGHGGIDGTQIFYSPTDNIAPQVFMDLPSEYSHEYFPRISNDGKWLIWGASRKGHEHDVADYEIFLWEIGTPWDNYIRFTCSEANDQWPDLYIE